MVLWRTTLAGADLRDSLTEPTIFHFVSFSGWVLPDAGSQILRAAERAPELQ
jgi:hypothetical protein